MHIEISSSEISVFFLIFCRLIGALSVVTGYSEHSVSIHVRVYLSVFLAMLFMPLVRDCFSTGDAHFLNYVTEVIIGVFAGSMIRVMTLALDMLGAIISSQSGLAFASMFSHIFSEQMTSYSLLFSLSASFLFLTLDMDHCFFKLLVNSYSHHYKLCNLGGVSLLINLISQSFSFAVTVGFPFMAVQLILMLVIGLINKFAPQAQLFFIMHPAQIVISALLIVLVINSIYGLYQDYIATSFSELM